MKDAKEFTSAQIGQPSAIMPDYTGEPFTGDGERFIGIDEFVVPRNFTEFYRRYPNCVRNWVSKKLRKASTHPDIEDWTNTLLGHLCTVPQGKIIEATDKEKARHVGGSFAKRGFVDVVNAYNPWAQHGASAKHFFSFVYKCLANKYTSLNSKHRKDAMWHQQFSLDADTPNAPNPEVGREYLLMSRSTQYAGEVQEAVPKTADQIFVDQFKDFLNHRDPSLIPLVDALMHKDKIEEILAVLGTDHNSFLRDRKRLQRLGRIFSGTCSTSGSLRSTLH